ncbi:MAG: hypothetical protein M3138_01345, partial [Actinomycetota bacterium]|nr:hypothetical protein [Actinomycetota bacterium]
RLHADVGPAGSRLDDLARRAAGRLSSAGRLASGRGDMPASANLLSRAVRLLPRGGNERSALLHDLAIALWQAGEVEEVEAVYREELEAGGALRDPVLEARSRLALAELRMGVDPASISAEELQREAERSIPILEEAGADEDLADALLILGTTHWLDGAISSMLDVSERALALSRVTGSVGRGAANYVGHALVLGTAHCDEALTRLETLVEQVADVRLWEATAALDLATIYAMLDRPDDAASRAERSLSTFEELGQSRWVAAGHHTCGVVHSLAGDAIRAEPEFRAACEWFEQRGEVFELAVHAVGLANGLLDLDRVDEAREIAEMSASSAAHYDLEAQIGWRAVIAKVLARSGEHVTAATHASDALRLVRETEFLDLRASVFLDMADVALRAGRRPDAEDAAHEALETYGRKGNRIGSRKAEVFLKAL